MPSSTGSVLSASPKGIPACCKGWMESASESAPAPGGRLCCHRLAEGANRLAASAVTARAMIATSVVIGTGSSSITSTSAHSSVQTAR